MELEFECKRIDLAPLLALSRFSDLYHDEIRRINDEQWALGWKPVGAIESMDSQSLYLVYERSVVPAPARAGE